MNKKMYIYATRPVLRKGYILLALITLLIATNWLNQNAQAHRETSSPTTGAVVLSTLLELPTEVGLISGRVFHDADSNAEYDAAVGDFPISDVEVTLTYPDGTWETQVTNRDGMYEFANLPLGDYRVTVDQHTLPNCKDTLPTYIKNLEPDEDPDPYVRLTSDTPQELDYDFGYEPIPGRINGTIFHDANADGRFNADEGDYPLEEVEVWLTGSDGSTETTQTSESGRYYFTDLPLGDYTVTIDMSSLPDSKHVDPTAAHADDTYDVVYTLTCNNPDNFGTAFGFEPSPISLSEGSNIDQETDIPTSVHVLETTSYMDVYSLNEIGMIVLTLLLLTQAVVQPVTNIRRSPRKRA